MAWQKNADVWTVLVRIGNRRRKRYEEFQLYANDEADAADFALHLASSKRAVVVSTRRVEG